MADPNNCRAVLLQYREWMTILKALEHPHHLRDLAAEIMRQLAEHDYGPYDRLASQLRGLATQQTFNHDLAMTIKHQSEQVADRINSLPTAISTAVQQAFTEGEFVKLLRNMPREALAESRQSWQAMRAVLEQWQTVLGELREILGTAKETPSDSTNRPPLASGPPSAPNLRRTFNPAAGAQRQRAADVAEARATREGFTMGG